MRDALIDAAHALIREGGVAAFRMSDACRRAGVSTAAPYRHFKDREHLIADVMIRGFERFSEVMIEARDAHPKGSVEAIVAMGLAFRRFAKADPELFHLMWSVTFETDPKPQERPECAGSFDILLDAVTPLSEAVAARDSGAAAADPRGFALALWSGVHGLTSLEIGGRLNVVEGVDPDQLIEWVTRAFVAGAAAPPATLFTTATAEASATHGATDPDAVGENAATSPRLRG